MIKHDTKQEQTQFAIPAAPGVDALSMVLTQSSEAYRQAFADWQKAVSIFVADRLQQDMESLQALAEERSFPALLKVQRDWFNAAMRDYTEEGWKLMEIAGRLAAAGFEAAKKSPGQEAPTAL